MTSPTPEPSGQRLLKIGALMVIGVVVLCGLAGTCLFAFSLVYPAFSQ